MAFLLNKISVFTKSMQFMNSSHEKLVKNLPDHDFRYLTQEFGFKNLELLKKKMLVLMNTWTVLKDAVKKNCMIRNVFTAL